MQHSLAIHAWCPPEMYHAYYVTWWIQRVGGPELFSGPHYWFSVPSSYANSVDAHVVALMSLPTNPYRNVGYMPGKHFYTVQTIETALQPPPAAPDPNDPTLEDLP